MQGPAETGCEEGRRAADKRLVEVGVCLCYRELICTFVNWLNLPCHGSSR